MALWPANDFSIENSIHSALGFDSPSPTLTKDRDDVRSIIYEVVMAPDAGVTTFINIVKTLYTFHQ